MRTLLALLLLTIPAGAEETIVIHATMKCFRFETMRKFLADTYHEAAIGGGIATGDQAAVQVYASENGKTFTILVIRKDGFACSLGGGRDWQPGNLTEKSDPS